MPEFHFYHFFKP